mmetsp:Transcript_105173/g.297225  ORF Transcript_105173/g.297225 Transcript_105173/m.297225 type:complete len:725 (-) Transcript_105173:126-2300(-)
MERQRQHALRIRSLLKAFAELPNLRPAREETKHCRWHLLLGKLRCQPADSCLHQPQQTVVPGLAVRPGRLGGSPAVDVHTRVPRGWCHLALKECASLWKFLEVCVVKVHLFNGVQRPCGHCEHRAALKVLGEGIHVQRGAHQQQPQGGPPRQHLTQQDEQKVGQQVPLVHLVYNNHIAVLQQWIVQSPAEQRPYRDKLDGASWRFRPDSVAVHGVADGVAELLTALPSHTLGDRDGCYATRLCHHDAEGRLAVPRVPTSPVIEQELRQLCGLPAACPAADHDNLLLRKRGTETLPDLLHRELAHKLRPACVLLGYSVGAPGLGTASFALGIQLQHPFGRGRTQRVRLPATRGPRQPRMPVVVVLARVQQGPQGRLALLAEFELQLLATDTPVHSTPGVLGRRSLLPCPGPLPRRVRLIGWDAQGPPKPADEHLCSQCQGNLLDIICRRPEHAVLVKDLGRDCSHPRFAARAESGHPGVPQAPRQALQCLTRMLSRLPCPRVVLVGADGLRATQDLLHRVLRQRKTAQRLDGGELISGRGGRCEPDPAHKASTLHVSCGKHKTPASQVAPGVVYFPQRSLRKMVSQGQHCALCCVVCLHQRLHLQVVCGPRFQCRVEITLQNRRILPHVLQCSLQLVLPWPSRSRDTRPLCPHCQPGPDTSRGPDTAPEREDRPRERRAPPPSHRTVHAHGRARQRVAGARAAAHRTSCKHLRWASNWPRPQWPC